MAEEIKELENTPEKAVYQFGEGKEALTLSIESGITTYKAETLEDNNPWPKGYHDENTNYLELTLSSNENSLYSIRRKGMKDAGYLQDIPPQVWPEQKVDYKREIAARLYDDKSKEATAVKKFLNQIEGNTIVDELKNLITEIPHLREIEAQQKKEQELKRQQEAEDYWQGVALKKENAKNALNKFVGADKIETAKEKSVATNDVATNRLASLRKKITHDIDEALGTNLEKKKMPLKGLEAGVSRIVEKMVSNKKVKD